jgi:phage terminase large subunit-like protein
VTRAARKPAPVQVSRAERNIVWIETHLRVPEGRHVGRPVVLREWQKQELRKIYDNPAGTRRAILSFARKNGKTALSAMILLLHLCGPEAVPNSQLFSAAQSRDQAAILFGLASKMVRMTQLSAFVTIRDTAKQLHCPELGTLYRALSAEASTAYGLSPVLVIHDELGQVKGPRSELYEALETATAAQDNPLSIIISTQAPTDEDLLSVLIDDAATGADPRTVLSLYTTPIDMDPFSEEAARLANPAFGDFQNAAEVMAMAADAKRMPSREAEFRNLVLNQRVQANNPFVSVSLWKSCGAVFPSLKPGATVYAGLDLSEVQDLTALVLVEPVGSEWRVHPHFWLPSDGLEEKSRRDRFPYDLHAEHGHLFRAPGKTIEYEHVAGFLADMIRRHDVRRVAFDRWNFKHLRPWLVRSGLSDETIDEVFVEFGQGFQSMSPALRELEGQILSGRLQHPQNPVLNWCAVNAVVSTDPAGNRKLNKSKSHGRIDGMVALAMAMSVAATHTETEASFWETL